MQNQSIILLGFSEVRHGAIGHGKTTLIAGPEVSGNDMVAIVEKAKRGNFPKGIKIIRGFHALPHQALIAVAPDESKQK